MARDTGLPSADAQFDFGRTRRRRILSSLADRLRGHGDVNVILPFDEVVAARTVWADVPPAFVYVCRRPRR